MRIPIDPPAPSWRAAARLLGLAAVLFAVATVTSFGLARHAPPALVTPLVALVVVLLGALLVAASAAPAARRDGHDADSLPAVMSHPGPSPVQPEGGAG